MTLKSSSQQLVDDWREDFTRAKMRVIATDPGAEKLAISSTGEFLATAALGRVTVWDVRTRAVQVTTLGAPELLSETVPQIHWSRIAPELLVISGKSLWVFSLITKQTNLIFSFPSDIQESVFDGYSNSLILWRNQLRLSLSPLSLTSFPVESNVDGITPLPGGFDPALECNHRIVLQGRLLTSTIPPPLQMSAHPTVPLLMVLFNQHQCELLSTNCDPIILPELDGFVQQACFLIDRSLLLLTGIASRTVLYSPPFYQQPVFLDSLPDEALIVVSHPLHPSAFGLTQRGSVWLLADRFRVEWMTAISPFGFRVIHKSEEYQESESEFDIRGRRSARDVSDLTVDLTAPPLPAVAPLRVFCLPPALGGVADPTEVLQRRGPSVPSSEEFERLYAQTH